MSLDDATVEAARADASSVIAEQIDLGAALDCGCNDMDIGCPCPACLSMADDIIDVLAAAGFVILPASSWRLRSDFRVLPAADHAEPRDG